MNVGDRVYCIRDIDTKFLNLVSVGSKNVMFKLFISGRCYRVLRINEDSIILNCEFNGDPYCFYLVYSDKYFGGVINNFYDYFKSLRQVRKEKLDFLGKLSLIERSSICEAIIVMEGFG